MTGPALGLLVLTAGFAVLDWTAVARSSKRLEHVAKPATMLVLIGAALALDPASEAQRWWFVAALVLSLAGDVFLMLPDRFVPGLAAFLGAHVAYIGGFRVVEDGFTPIVLAVLLLLPIAIPLGTRVTRGAADRDARLRRPVSAYIAVITVMVAAAAATMHPLAIAGALFFYASDAMIGWSRFVRGFAGAPVAIIVTYHVGQVALVVSLA